MAGKALKCPNCGATQKGKLGIEQTTVVCPYCQTQILVPQDLRGVELRASSGHPVLWVVLGITVVTAIGVAVLAFALLGREGGSDVPAPAASIPQPVALPAPSASASAVPDAAQPDSPVVLSFGKPGKQPGELNDPRAIVVSRSGEVYVADFAPPRLQKFDANGKFLVRIDLGDVERRTITDLGMNSADELYVIVGGNILRFAADGTLKNTIAGGKERYYRTLAIDSTGTIYAAALTGKETDILKLDANGRVLAHHRAPFAKIFKRVLPQLEVDETGNLYALPRQHSEMLVLGKKGEYLDRVNVSQLCGAGSTKPMTQDGKGNLVFGGFDGLTVCTTSGKKLTSVKLPRLSGTVRGVARAPDGDYYVTTNRSTVLKLRLGS